MAEDKGTTDTVDADEPEDVDTTDTATDTTDTDKPEDTPDTVSRAELDKVIAARDKLKAKLRELSKPADTTDKAEPTEADKLRAALVRTAGASALATSGITDKAEQDALLSMLKVDGLDVSEDGTVDTDNLVDTLDTLRRIFAPKDKPRPPRVDTKRGQGDSGSGEDADAKRYRRIRTGQV